MANPARARGRQVNLVQALALLLAFLLIAGIGGVLSAGLVMPAVAGVSAIANSTTEVFSDLPTELAEQPLSQKSTVLANDGTTVLATFYLENRIVVPLEKIAPVSALAPATAGITSPAASTPPMPAMRTNASRSASACARLT